MSRTARTRAPILLASGLPLRKDRPTSFFRQLRLLAALLGRRGREVILLGPNTGVGQAAAASGPISAEALPFGPTSAFVRRSAQTGGAVGMPFAGIRNLIGRSGARAAILLGYPDQFPFLTAEQGLGLRLYLWAQFSRPPDPRSLGQATAVPLTPKTAEFLAQAGVGRAGPARIGPVIPHGVDTAVYRPLTPAERRRARRRYGLEAGFVVGAVGANSFRKRFDRILESYALFSRTVEGAFLLLKTDRLISREGVDLDSMAEKLGIGSRVRFITEELSEAKLRDLYGSMDVLLNLSEWEGFCLPAVEAMACGVPVITHPVQGSSESVPYPELLVPASKPYIEGGTVLLQAQPEQAARVLQRAAKHPSLLARLSAQGRAEAQRSFDIRRVAELWVQLIDADLAREG